MVTMKSLRVMPVSSAESYFNTNDPELPAAMVLLSGSTVRQVQVGTNLTATACALRLAAVTLISIFWPRAIMPNLPEGGEKTSAASAAAFSAAAVMRMRRRAFFACVRTIFLRAGHPSRRRFRFP